MRFGKAFQGGGVLFWGMVIPGVVWAQYTYVRVSGPVFPNVGLEYVKIFDAVLLPDGSMVFSGKVDGQGAFIGKFTSCGQLEWFRRFHVPDYGSFALDVVASSYTVVSSMRKAGMVKFSGGGGNIAGTFIPVAGGAFNELNYDISWSASAEKLFVLGGNPTETGSVNPLYLLVFDSFFNPIGAYGYTIIDTSYFRLPLQVLPLPDSTVVICGVFLRDAQNKENVFVLRHDPFSGNLLWSKSIGTPQYREGDLLGSMLNTAQHMRDPNRGDCALSPDRRYIYLTVPLLDYPQGNGGTEILVVKLDTAGNLLAHAVVGGPSHDIPRRIVATPWNDIAILGTTQQNSPLSRAFLLILDTSLSVLKHIVEYPWNDARVSPLIVYPDSTYLIPLLTRISYGSGFAHQFVFVKADSTGKPPCSWALLPGWTIYTYLLQDSAVFAQAIPYPLGVGQTPFSEIQVSVSDSLICTSCNFPGAGIEIMSISDTVCFHDTLSIVFRIPALYRECTWYRRIDSAFYGVDTVIQSYVPGMHVVSLFCPDDSSWLVASDTFYISDSILIHLSDTALCETDTLTITFQPAGGIPPYQVLWTSVPASTCDTCFTTSWPVLDTFVISVTVQDALGCSSSDSFRVFALPLPRFVLKGRDTLCQDDTLMIFLDSLQASSLPVQVMIYGPSDTFSAVSQIEIHPASPAHTGIWVAVVEDSQGCIFSDSFQIQVFPLPQVDLTGDTGGCFGDTLYVQANVSSGTSPYSFAWTPGSPDLSVSCTTCPGVFIVSSDSGSFSLYLSVTDSLGCTADSTVIVTFYSLPEFHLPDTFVCPGQPITVSIPAGTMWHWSPEGIVTCPTCSTTEVRSSYSTYVIATAWSEQGCTYQDSFFLFVDTSSYAVIQNCPEISSSGEVRVVKGSGGPLSLIWEHRGRGSVAGYLLDSSGVIFHVPQSPGVDTLILMGVSPYGCVAMDTCVIVVPEPTCENRIWVPNTFTPDGDGRNDILYVYATRKMVIREWKIFNRWGELVFSVGDVSAGPPSLRSAIGWDGTFRGKPASPDVYVYYLVVECGRKTFFLKGDVTLLR